MKHSILFILLFSVCFSENYGILDDFHEHDEDDTIIDDFLSQEDDASSKINFVTQSSSTSLTVLENFAANSSSLLERRLPQAIIIGVKKGGTRALLEYLRLHPQIRAPGPETHFFDRYYDRGLEWYRKQMPPTSADQVTVEKTPCYFVRRDVPKRVFDMNPSTKLLIVVKDPITRALSDYAQSHSKGRAIDLFPNMAFVDRRKQIVDQKWSAIRIGLYIKHVSKWLPYFPLKQMHFVSGEKLITDPVPELRMVEDFLNLPHQIQQDRFQFDSEKGFPCVKRHLEDTVFKCLGKTKGRIHPKIGNRTREMLRRFYWSYNDELFRLVGRNFGWNDHLLR